MHIIYAVTTCSDRVYKQLFDHVKVKPAFQSQKYHRLLIEGLAKGAAVDVVTEEPMNPANPLLTCPNCIITPHIAWAPKESRQRLMDIAVNNLEAFVAGNPINIVNK